MSVMTEGYQSVSELDFLCMCNYMYARKMDG